MTDFINKMIALLLIVCMLLIAPLVEMRHMDRTQNKMNAINAMELFNDTVADAHQIDEDSYIRLVKTLESCGITADVTISTYVISIADGKTYMWKTAIIDDLSAPIPLELGDIIELHVEEKTLARAHNIWGKLFRTTTDLFDETLVKMIK